LSTEQTSGGPRRRVLIVTAFGQSLVEMRGGLVRAMRDAGLDVTIAAPTHGSDQVEGLASIGAAFRPLDIDRGGLNPFRELHYAVRLARCIRSERPDFILAIALKPVVYCGLVAAFFPSLTTVSVISGLGYVFTGRSLRQRALAGAARLMYKVALRRSRLVFFQNADDRDQFVAWRLVTRARTAVTNGDGVDLARFAVRQLPGMGHFLLIGRLLSDKGVMEYAAAARTLHATWPEARFRLVGWFDDANPNAIAREVVERWVRDGTIEFLGFLPDVRASLEDTDVYVLPSYREGLSRTTCEAMAMGRPIVTTDAPGCRQTVVEGVNGYLVPVGDAAALAAAMAHFLSDPSLVERMGADSRRLAEERYDMDTVNAALVERMLAGDRPGHRVQDH
jgi:glycosyltransferase involved in cell wall biosynthesis